MRYTTLGLLAVCALVSGCATIRVQGVQPNSRVWVCHGGKKAKWHSVSANAASAHRRHGDRVSDSPQPKGQRC